MTEPRTLPLDVTRCEGLMPQGDCPERETCLRYLQREAVAERLSRATYVCDARFPTYAYKVPA